MTDRLKRTHTCGQIRANDVGQEIILMGWIHRRRTHGGLIFVDMRDRHGLTQVVFNPSESAEAHAVVEGCRSEFVIAVVGTVRQRPEGTLNPHLATGEIEVIANSVQILNTAKTTPFEINQETEIDESLRLKYRYLDIRRENMRDNLVQRYHITRFLRRFLDSRDFVEIETPNLVNETPGGAREFLVPSRLNPGSFYALPQSPQQYKQLLMVGGMDRYFQIARCFRDEDLRSDRQPEFTQLDIEMSFVDQSDIWELTEQLLVELAEAVTPEKSVQTFPFPHITFQEAMDLYGNDKPDMRFGLTIVDLTAVYGSGFQVFDIARAGGGQVRAIRAPGCAAYSRREIDELNAFARQRGAKGLATIAYSTEGPRGPIAKFFDDETHERVRVAMGAEVGDLILIVADRAEIVANVLGELRLEIGRRLKLMDPNILAFCWLTEVPAFEWDDEAKCYAAKHHQFTSPLDEDLELLDTNPGLVRAKQYDIVLNGYELGGGSIRIHRREIQEKVFRIIGLTDERARQMFGHLLDAFEYGTPPHGGIALGLDRLAMILAGASTIRETIAFPKTQSGTEPMTGSPSPVTDKELRDLHIRVSLPVAQGTV